MHTQLVKLPSFLLLILKQENKWSLTDVYVRPEEVYYFDIYNSKTTLNCKKKTH